MVKFGTKTIQSLAPDSGKGKVKNISTALRVAGSGVGFNVIAGLIDGLILKGTVSSLGFVIPVLGIRLSLIDVANYLAHNGGGFMPKSIRPIIAVGAAKAAQGTISLASINPLSVLASRSGGPGTSAGSVASGGGL